MVKYNGICKKKKTIEKQLPGTTVGDIIKKFMHAAPGP